MSNYKKRYRNNYDVAIRIESINKILDGWDIKYGIDGMKKYLSMKEKKILLIGLLGLKKSGKSFVLSKLLNENDFIAEESDNLYLKYAINPEKNFELAIVDIPGLGRPLKENIDYSKVLNEKYIKELEKYNNQTDNFLMNFILKKSNFIICVVGYLNFNEQKFLNKLKIKDEEYKKEFKQLKKIFVIHNLKELSTINEISEYINNVLLKSITFKLDEKFAQKTLNPNNNTKFYIEKNDDKELEIYHLIIAKEGSEAGNYYNESTYNIIIQQYNSFHFFNTFDIIKEIKEELKLISKNIFINQITSLDDFENIETKIKLKNKFEFKNNTDENADFSFLSLKPKYSYYKINNNTQLLVIIEMPGQIKDYKFTCDKKPKNGFYIMKFSGKKVMNLPDNLEEQKKKGLFFSNIDCGDFEETIKISNEKYQLKSYEYQKEEEKGQFKYYFELVNNEYFSDADD